MSNPFPGMDPYLEEHWRDVHASFMIYCRDQIQEQLPPELIARVEERVAIDFGGVAQLRYPDVKIAERPGEYEPSATSPLAIAVDEPVVLLLDDEPLVETYVTIVDRQDDYRVVTAIELLSPTNKVPREGREAYRDKQLEYVEAGINLVEIDLLRNGESIVYAPMHKIKPARRTPYTISVRRASQPRKVAVYLAPLRSKLPPIKIPLRPTDADVVLDLQGLIDLCHRRGRYESIDYRREPEPPFTPDDAQWADLLLREKQLR
jgi:hypothetical protein